MLALALALFKAADEVFAAPSTAFAKLDEDPRSVDSEVEDTAGAYWVEATGEVAVTDGNTGAAAPLMLAYGSFDGLVYPPLTAAAGATTVAPAFTSAAV